MYIINHAEDRWLFVEPVFLPLIKNIADQLPSIERFVVLCESDALSKTRLEPVCSEYNRSDSLTSSHTDDGWLDTGDVATIDAGGFMTITDRSKDLIKSGGEWISSIGLENIAAGHPGVREAAIIAVPDEKWSERPLLVVVASDNRPLDVDELLTMYQGKVVKWWIPDRVVILDELPYTATGKVRKADLREQLAKSE